ncbi:MAG: DUF3592 domain-containing protein [Chloroflexota bacterium]
MIFGVAIAFLFLFEGLRRSSRFIFLIFEWKRSQGWLTTPGKVVHSRLKSTFVSRGGRKSHNLDGSVRLVTAYIPDVVYEYRANAEVFQSSQIFIGQQFPSPLSFASGFIEKYPVGKEVDVFYNPEKPATAVLERNRFKELSGQLVGGILFLLLGFAILIQVIQS